MKKSMYCILLAAASIPAFAANFSGKWIIIPEQGRGRRAPMVLTLNQVGNEVTGSITPPRGVSTGSPASTEIFAGKVDGDVLSFYLWTGFDRPAKARYQGTLSGDDLILTVTTDNVGQPGNSPAGPAKVTAKRTR